MNARGLAFILIIGCGALLFNNCARLASPDVSGGTNLLSLSGSGSAACMEDLKTVYAQTYHPFLKTNCQGCHSNAHGSSDVGVSFNAFINYSATKVGGQSLIDYQATHAHGGNSFGPQMQPQIDAFKPTWNVGMDAYNACLRSGPTPGSGGGGTEASSGRTIELGEKTVTGIEQTRTNATLWRTVSWNTAVETTTADQQNVLKSTFTIEVRYFMNGTNLMGLMFRNPKLRLAAGQDGVRLQGLALKLDGQNASAFTTYDTLDIVVSGTTEVSLAPGFGSAVYMQMGTTADSRVAFEIVGLRASTDTMPNPEAATPITMPTGPSGPTTPAPGGGAPAVITFANLIGTDSSKNVFATSCVSCHGSVSPPKGLNLKDYSLASGKAAVIQARMKDSVFPMPPAGLLSSGERALVDNWIQNGLKP